MSPLRPTLWPRRPRSLRARVTAGSVILLTVVLTATVVIAALLVRGTIEDGISGRAASAAHNVAGVIADQPIEEPIPPQNGVARVQVVDSAGSAVAASATMAERAPVTDVRPGASDPEISTTECDLAAVAPDDCLSVAGVTVTDSPYGTVTVYAAVPVPKALSLGVVEAGLALMGGLVLVLAGGGVWWAVGRSLRPVGRITTELERITAADLSRRVPEPAAADEIGDLARTVNATLERLDTAVARQRQFVSAASHELRTPIAGLRTRLELAITETDDRDSRETLTAILGDTDRLAQIVDDLLQLGRLDAEIAQACERFDLGELVALEVDRQHFPTDATITTETTPDAVVEGNRTQITRLLVNLLANAGRHAAGRVLVTVTAENGTAVLHVHDDGSGVAEQDRARVFERFARLAEARNRDPGGTGLGLPIAREIALVHDGSLSVGDSDQLGGAVFVVRLPLHGT